MYPIEPSCQIAGLEEIYAEYLGERVYGAFVEVGAHDGIRWSNTRGLALTGWRGLYVEANPVYARQCKENCINLPNITVLDVAVGRERGRESLYLGGSLSTLKRETIAAYNTYPGLGGLSLENAIEVDVVTLDEILASHHWPARYEVLVLDVEGSEMDVLSAYSIERWTPTLAIVETHETLDSQTLSAAARPIGDYFEYNHYRKIHADSINSVYMLESK